MKPLITISIPVYNVEKYVRRGLLSALNQDYENIEILVVDDKGSDKSLEIILEIIASHPRGKVVKIIDHEFNKGLGATRNSSIENAQGEYIMFMDSDDYLTSDCITKLYSALASRNADICVGSFIHFDVNTNRTNPHTCKDHVYVGRDAFMQFYYSPDFYIQTWNKLYRLELLRSNNIYCIPSNTNEDIFFCYQLFPVSSTIATISDVTYWYAIGDSNAVTSSMRKNIMQEKRLIQYIGILNEMNALYRTRGNIGMAKFFLEIKAGLIRDICWSKNTSNLEKLAMLNKIPEFSELETNDFISTVIPNLRKYLGSNPIKVAKRDKAFNVPFKIYRKIIRFIGRK